MIWIEKVLVDSNSLLILSSDVADLYDAGLCPVCSLILPDRRFCT